MSPPPAAAGLPGAGRPGAGRPGLARHLPEPARFWIAYAPRSWNLAASSWTDLAGASVRALRPPPGRPSTGGLPGAGLPDLAARDLDDLFYLPPVPPHLAAERDRWAAGLVESGTPVLIQLAPGEEAEVPAARVVYDLLTPLLSGELDRLSLLPPGSTAVWPLISSLTDSPELVERGCDLLAAAAVCYVQPLAVELSAADRRALAESRGEETFDALFHGAAPSERDFARRASRRGLDVFTPRLPAGPTPRRRRNRALAADLALAGELWLRLGRSVNGGQALFRAARGADATSHDLTALAREGNLDVLDWLDATGVEMLREIVAEGESSLLASLLEEYLSE